MSYEPHKAYLLRVGCLNQYTLNSDNFLITLRSLSDGLRENTNSRRNFFIPFRMFGMISFNLLTWYGLNNRDKSYDRDGVWTFDNESEMLTRYPLRHGHLVNRIAYSEYIFSKERIELQTPPTIKQLWHQNHVNQNMKTGVYYALYCSFIFERSNHT